MSSSVVELLYNHSKTFPDKPAFIINDEVISYRTLFSSIVLFKDILKDKGIKRGDYVIIRACHSVGYWVSLLSLCLLEAISIPLEKDLKDETIVEINEKVKGVKLIISSKEEKAINAMHIFINDIIIQDYEFDEASLRFAKKDSIESILFTTGTTGKSKGVVHRNTFFLDNSLNLEYLPYDKDTIMLLSTPPNHVFAIGRVSAVLVNRGTVVYVNGLSNLLDFYNALEKYNVNSLALTPSLLNYVITFTIEELIKYQKQLRYIELGGEKLSYARQIEYIKLFPYTRLFTTYASTETGIVTAYEFSKYGPSDNRVGPYIGYPIITFLDENDKVFRATKDNPGLMLVDAHYIMYYYFEDPIETAKVKRGSGVLMSDLGYIDEDNFICLTGRKGDVIMSGGFKINPNEVENIALLSGLVKECVCVGKEDPILGKLLVLLVVVEEDINLNDLKKFIVSKLEGYKVPKEIKVVDSIKKTDNGKIDRKYYRNNLEV